MNGSTVDRNILGNFGTGMVLTTFLISHAKTTTPQELKTAASDFILSLTLALCWWARGKMHHCNHPVSSRDSVQSPMSKWVFVEQHTDQNTQWSDCLWVLRHFLSQYAAFRISEAACKSTAKMITPPNKS